MLSRLEFRNRFTIQEKVTIELAAADVPTAPTQQRALAATLRVFLDDLASANYVDETRPDTIAGVRQLEQYGLIAPGRADEILAPTGTDTPVDATEYTLAADAPVGDGYAVLVGGTYAADALVECYRVGDELKQSAGAFSARHCATGEA